MSIVTRRRAGAGFLVALSSCANPSYGELPARSDAGAQGAASAAVDDAGRVSAPTKLGDASSAAELASAARDAASDPHPALDGGDAPPLVGAEAGATTPTGPVGSPTQPDAGTSPPHVLPAWAGQLPGVYALRAQEFSVSSSTWVRWISVAKMEITQSGDQLTALMSTCLLTAITQAGTDLGRTDGASKLPPRRFEVTLADDTFTISPLEINVGYDATPPASCEGHEGSTVMKRPFQTWISGSQCTCGIESLPQVNDCRVTDPDNDGRPGYSSSSHAFTEVTTWGVTETYSKFIEGHVGNDQAHTALFKEDERLNQFGCDPVGACTSVNAATVCPVQYNRTLFAPLRAGAAPSGGWTCAAIEANLSTLFPGPQSPFPTDCSKP